MLAVFTKIPGLPCGFKIAFTHSVVKNWHRNCRVTLTAISYVVLSESPPQSYQLQKLSHFQPLQRLRQYLQLFCILSVVKIRLFSNNYIRLSPITVLMTSTTDLGLLILILNSMVPRKSSVLVS